MGNTVTEVAKTRTRSTLDALKVVVIEIGAGGNVPTVRQTSEQSLLRLLDVGADAHLVRVNPDLPLADSSALIDEFMVGERPPAHPNRVISIPSRGLAAIREIDSHYQQLSRSSE